MANISLPFGGEVVFYADGAQAQGIAVVSGLHGSNIAALMGNRERFDYVWTDAAGRTGQTGMVQGSRGYQMDTKTEYIYDPTWRLATPYAEFSISSIAAGGGYNALTGWSLDASRSTDTTMVTIAGNAATIVRPGLYTVSIVGKATQTSTSFLDITTDAGPTPVDIVAIGPLVANVGQVTLNDYRVLTANTPLYLWVGNVSSAVTDLRLRVSRSA